jgi:S1-C subfamily serine protease
MIGIGTTSRVNQAMSGNGSDMVGGRRRLRGFLWVGIAAWVVASGGAEPTSRPSELRTRARQPLASDNLTFRPTVLIRKGNSQGSGSVIASVNGETLVLTVVHVVQEPGDLTVELHRYNLGLERRNAGGTWPRVVQAEIVAQDADADVAILRIRGMVALPYVARLAEGEDEPAPGTAVTSLGIDLATNLSSWSAKVVGVARRDLKHTGQERPFLVTDRGPEHGRSGGGLFRGDGRLVGVCVGRIEQSSGRWIGIFASGESIRRLIQEQQLGAAIARSEKWHVAHNRREAPTGRTPITETQHRPLTPTKRAVEPSPPAPKPRP